jgi:transposase-like protein
MQFNNQLKPTGNTRSGGYPQKNPLKQYGEGEISTPRDRKGRFKHDNKWMGFFAPHLV